MSTASTVRGARTFLFVPADRGDRLAKALASGADAAVVDLEDAIAPMAKDAARAAMVQAWDGIAVADRNRLLVRINGAGSTWWQGDLDAVRHLRGLAGLLVPKAERPASLQEVALACPSAALVPMLESAEGLHSLDLLARCPDVARFAFGHLDFQSDLGIECSPEESELQAARLQLVVTSRRFGLAAPIDGVTVTLDDTQRLEQDVRRSRRSGFGAKLCIHPRQLEAANRLLRASEEQRAWAVRVLQEAQVHGEAAFQLDGRMVDAPVLLRARSYLAP